MNRLESVDTRTIRDHVVGTLERAIIAGTLAPHASLSDRALSSELGVSRTPVRDALQVLEATGLVERRGRVGWMVTGITRQDVEELFELRRLIEPAGIERVVTWPDERRLALAHAFDEVTGDGDDEGLALYLARDDAFHNELVAATGNRRLVGMYGVTRLQIQRVRCLVSYRVEGRVERSRAEHRDIGAAIARRDAGAAIHALVGHIVSAESAYLALYKDREARLAAPSSRGGELTS